MSVPQDVVSISDGSEDSKSGFDLVSSLLVFVVQTMLFVPEENAKYVTIFSHFPLPFAMPMRSINQSINIVEKLQFQRN